MRKNSVKLKAGGGDMDKQIRMLLIKLSPRFKITVTTIMSYNDETSRFSTVIKLRVKRRFDGSVSTSEHYGKRDLISELVKWLND